MNAIRTLAARCAGLVLLTAGMHLLVPGPASAEAVLDPAQPDTAQQDTAQQDTALPGTAQLAGASRAAGVTTATVLRWSDGDTATTSAGRVRLIGIDTVETGACGAEAARLNAQRLAPVGSRVRLVSPASVRNRDDYGRLLRYVVARGKDVGLAQIRKGAQARYDSRTGYDHHPKQRRYVRTDRAHALAGCGAGAGAVPAPASSAPAPVAAAPSGGSCPASAPIKGNQGTNGWIYHQPWQEYYTVTNPEQCFATAAAAEAAGYWASMV